MCDLTDIVKIKLIAVKSKNIKFKNNGGEIRDNKTKKS